MCCYWGCGIVCWLFCSLSWWWSCSCWLCVVCGGCRFCCLLLVLVCCCVSVVVVYYWLDWWWLGVCVLGLFWCWCRFCFSLGCDGVGVVIVLVFVGVRWLGCYLVVGWIFWRLNIWFFFFLMCVVWCWNLFLLFWYIGYLWL